MRKSFIAMCVSAVFLGILCGPVAWSSDGSAWELTFQFEGSAISLQRAVRVSPMRKRLSEPNLQSFPLVVHCELDWLDAEGDALHFERVDFPLGAWFDDFANRTGGSAVPRKGCCPVRLSGPPPEIEPSRVRLRRTGAVWNEEPLMHEGVPEAFQFEEITFDIEDGLRKTAVEPGPIGITKVHDSGDDDNRILIVVLGDGYTEQNLADGLFERDVERLMDAYRASPVWSDYLQAVNVYRIDIVSKEEGVDLPDSGILVDTYLDGNYAGGRLKVNHSRVATTIFQYLPPVWPESILVLCNTPVYSGHAGDRIGTSYNGDAMEGVALHEQGHQFGDLADEYEHGRDTFPAVGGLPNLDITFERDRLVWKTWVEPDTPLPTPETPEFASVVGAFEGAGGWPTDIYRPFLECMMRSYEPFCPVCQEALAIKIIDPLELADLADPEIGTTIVLDSSPTTIAVNPLSVSPLAYEWKLAGSTVTNATSPRLTLTADALKGEATAELNLKISHPTVRVRKTTLFDEYSWILDQEDGTSVSNWRRYE